MTNEIKGLDTMTRNEMIEQVAKLLFLSGEVGSAVDCYSAAFASTPNMTDHEIRSILTDATSK